MIKWIKKLFSNHPHVKSMENQRPKGSPTPIFTTCKNCGETTYSNLPSGREANIISKLIKFYFVKPEIKDAFNGLCQQDDELMTLVKCIFYESAAEPGFHDNPRNISGDISHCMMTGGYAETPITEETANKLESEGFFIKNVDGKIHLGNMIHEEDAPITFGSAGGSGSDGMVTLALPHTECSSLDVKTQEMVVATYQDLYSECIDKAKKQKLMLKIIEECGTLRDLHSEEYKNRSDEELHQRCEKMLDDFNACYWLKDHLENKQYLRLAHDLLEAMSFYQEKRENNLKNDDDLFNVGARLMQEHNNDWALNKKSSSEQANPSPSPVLNKEQLQALAATKVPEKVREAAEAHWNSLSVSKLSWIPINERLPNYTKEDYLRQDSLCNIRVKYENGVIETLIGLYCPIIELFRKTNYYFDDNEDYYHNLPKHKPYYDGGFYADYEGGVTHWMPLSQQHSKNPNTIYFDQPVRGWMGKPAGTIFKYKEPHEIILNDLPWIKPSDRLPKYTHDQWCNDESKCLIKFKIDGEIKIVLWFPERKYFSIDSNAKEYKPEEIECWFPISTESV